MTEKQRLYQEERKKKMEEKANSSITTTANAPIQSLTSTQAASATYDELSDGHEPRYVYVRIKEGNEKKPINIRISPLTEYNNKNEVVRERFPLIDKWGNPVNVVVMETAQMILDVNTEYGKKLYECMQNQGIYVHNMSNPPYTFSDIEEEAETTITDFELTLDAGNAINAMSADELREFARLFAMNTDSMSDQRIKADMIAHCQKQPGNILKAVSDPDREIRETFRRASHRKVVTTKNGVYSWGDAIMGSSYEEAITWMKNNPELAIYVNKQANVVKS